MLGRIAAVLLTTSLLFSPLLGLLGDATTNVAADSFPSLEKRFYMHDGTRLSSSSYDWLNSSGPNNPGDLDFDSDGLLGVTIKKNLPSQKWRHFWVLDPEAGSDIHLQGDFSARIWAGSRDNDSGSQITVRFSDIAPGQWSAPDSWTLIGTATTPLTGPVYSAFKPYSFNVTGVDYVLQAGHFLVLTIQRGDSVNDGLLVVYDDSYFDSYVTIKCTNFVSVDAAWTEDSAGSARILFSDGEQITLLGNVSDPFGAYEILNANATVALIGNGTVVLPLTSMSLNATDPSVNPYWKLFSLGLPMLGKGDYRITIYAEDPQGMPSWLNCTLTIVAADHFSVDAPSTITDGTPFSMTMSALNETDAVITNWVGSVSIDSYRVDMVTHGFGALSVKSANFTLADGGVHTLPNEVYDFAEETIMLRVSSGSHVGWSSPVVVRSGPVVSITLTPSGDVTNRSGTSIPFTAQGKDALNRTNTTWTPTWSSSGGIGTIAGAGLTVTFNAVTVGTGRVECANLATGASAFTNVNVIAGDLSRIVISPAGPITLREGKTVTLTATGYDSEDNTVDISSAVWSTNTSGQISGVGSSAVFRAGFVPERGVAEVALWGVNDSVQITIINAQNGPWLSTIPPQIYMEDSKWTLSLSTYWHHLSGTANLRWFVEGVNTSLYIILHDPDVNSNMMFLTQPDKFGNTVFRLWVRDQDGFSTYQDVTVSVQAVNDRPRFVNNPPTELYVKFGLDYVFDYSYYVNDVDTPKEDLIMTSDATGRIGFDGLIATFNYPAEKDNYFQIVKLTVSDASDLSGIESSNSDTLSIVVWVTNDAPPVLDQPLPDPVHVLEGEMNHYAFNLDLYFSDPDNDVLYFTKDFQNIVIDIRANHSVYISAPTEWSGSTTGVFSANDSTGALKTDIVTVIVDAVNDPPEIDTIGSVHVRYDVSTYLDVSLYVHDPDHALGELIFNVNSSYITYAAQQLILLFPPSLVGPVFTSPYIVYVNLTVRDPLGANDSEEFKVIVSDNYAPTVRFPLPYYNIFSFPEDSWLNGSLDLSVLFDDQDDSVLTFNVTGNTNVVILISPSGLVNFTAKTNWSGSESVVFTATDPHMAKVMWAATVLVIPVNDPPVLLQIPDKVIRGGPRSSHFSILEYMYDSETPARELVVVSNVDAVQVIGGVLYYSLPNGVDVITVTIYVRDPDGAQSNSVTFKLGVSKTTAQLIGWPYSFPLVLLAAGVIAYFVAMRMPRPYSLENIFLIHNDGRLIAHVTKEENTNLDKDVVSAMFTAVQEFVRDSFQQGELGLKKLEIGHKNVMIEKGASVYLAMIYSGWPKKEVFESLSMLVRDIEERYKGRIERWNGMGKSLKGVEQMLQTFMANEFKPGAWPAEEEGMGEQEWVEILDKES